MLFKLRKTKTIIFVWLMAGWLLAAPALAQDIGIGENKNAGIAGKQSGFRTGGIITDNALLDTVVGEIIAYTLGFIGIIFLALIFYSGIQWMAAGGNEEKVAEAKKRIIQSSVGLALILLSYLIVYWIFRFFYSQLHDYS